MLWNTIGVPPWCIGCPPIIRMRWPNAGRVIVRARHEARKYFTEKDMVHLLRCSRLFPSALYRNSGAGSAVHPAQNAVQLRDGLVDVFGLHDQWRSEQDERAASQQVNALLPGPTANLQREE